MSRAPLVRAAAVVIAFLLATGEIAGAPVTSRTPNISSVEAPQPLAAEFLFAHRFNRISSKVINSPTFTLELGLASWLSASVRYATSSQIDASVNEWEPMAKLRLLAQERHLLDVALLAGYNTAANSFDGALLVRRRVWLVSLLGNLAGFSDGFDVRGKTLAGGLGAQIHLTRFLQIGGDVNRVLDAQRADPMQARWRHLAWSAGLSFQIPYSPHSMSLYATNANTSTLEGAARGRRQWLYGFEFQVPLGTAARWKAIVVPPPAPAPGEAPAARPAEPGPPAATVEVAIQGNAFRPAEVTVAVGSTVRWTNRDAVEHTATSSEGAWDSGIMQAGATYARRFDRAGRYPYICSVHPFMKGTVVVR